MYTCGVPIYRRGDELPKREEGANVVGSSLGRRWHVVGSRLPNPPVSRTASAWGGPTDPLTSSHASPPPHAHAR